MLLFAGTAQASTKEIRLVSDIAGMHCKLWLGHIQGKQVPLSPEELSLLLKRTVTEEEAEQFRYRFNGLPDFGFVLGQRWQVASRADRHNFNFYFSQWLDKQFALRNNYEEPESCNFNINLTALPNTPDGHIGNSPQPRRLKAIAQTVLPGENTAAVVIYELRQDNLGWRVHEIYINNQGLREQYEQSFGERIADSGFRGLITYLINEAANG